MALTKKNGLYTQYTDTVTPVNNRLYTRYVDSASLGGAGGANGGAYGYTPKKTTITPRANQYASAMADAVNRLNSIQRFTYDQKNDPLYQQYAEMYQKNAKLAMQDTVGQATALTGGYGSSYAETAGQSMYNQQMNQLNDKALDLYNASLNAYNSYVDLAGKQASAATSAFGADQSAINTEVDAAQWNADFDEKQAEYAADLAYKYAQQQENIRQFNANLAENQRQFNANYSLDQQKFNYQKYTNDRDYNRSVFESDRSYDYQKERDNISDAQYAEKVKQAQLDAQNDLAYKYAVAGLNPDGTLSAAEKERLSYQYGSNNYKSGSSSNSSSKKSVSKVTYTDLGYAKSTHRGDTRIDTLESYLNHINNANSDSTRANLIADLYYDGKISENEFNDMIRAYQLNY